MKRNVWLLLLLPLCLFWGCSQKKVYTDSDGPYYEGAHCEFNPEFTGSIKVVSYNIKLGEEIARAISELTGVPELCGADIILLQEMDPEGTGQIAEELGYNYVYFPAAIHAKHSREFGNAILTRWPITDSWKLLLPHQDPIRKNRRIAAVATIAIDKYEILTYSVHTEMVWLALDERIAQVDSVIRSVSEIYSHVIIGGDFNTESDYYVGVAEDLFEGAGFIRASRGVGPTSKTGPAGLVDLRLDHIFTRGFSVLDKGKVDDMQASDHLPIWVKLKIE
ncbi:endonuclease/exonuclease/phosphatase family protein [Candidatus Eisenbacteria bacterium]|uniref:Endonuclease/exonuclease/phosphatase family protein n=1 Tax=Eiseniibacteriota bacterium TaxID=2212470 RepID=A0ABV6YNW9_UNCEI